MNSHSNALDNRDFARIARAIRFIDSHFSQQPRLAEIAADVGLSEFHFNRLFRRWAGLTPKQYLAFVTGSMAKSVLEERKSVLDTAYAVGLSGPGRLHDLVVTLEAVTPGELKSKGQGIQIRFGFSATPFGRALVAVTDRGVCHLSFTEPGEDARELKELQDRWPGARLQRDDGQAAVLAGRIWNPTARRATSVNIAVTGTNFQLKVWQALLDLGARSTTTYTNIAAEVGAPAAVRAVGNAVGSNPVAWLIPCHQVLRKSGALGGYRWGLDRKRAMLTWNALCNGPGDVERKRVNRGL